MCAVKIAVCITYLEHQIPFIIISVTLTYCTSTVQAVTQKPVTPVSIDIPLLTDYNLNLLVTSSDCVIKKWFIFFPGNVVYDHSRDTRESGGHGLSADACPGEAPG